MRSEVIRGIAILALALILVGVMMSVHWPQTGQDQQTPTNEDVARSLFGDSSYPGYGLIMFLIGLLLLVALLGGIFLAKEEKE